ncbi:unnamed protein product [Lathyrus sativus]|nr:unnamed protein product [Lathyrus sativus]
MLKFIGFSNSGFIVSTKVAEENVSQRYENEIMEFGTILSSKMRYLLVEEKVLAQQLQSPMPLQISMQRYSDRV